MTLGKGDAFPCVLGKNVDGEAVDLAELAGEGWAVVLLYRGHW
jgi:hypothetical protein